MAYICENELRQVYEDVSDKLFEQGYQTEIALVRDYLLKVAVGQDDMQFGKLIIDYSPKKKTHSFRKDTDLSDELYQEIVSIINGQVSFNAFSITSSKQADCESQTGQVILNGNPENVSTRSSGYEAYVDGSFIDSRIGYGSVILKDGEVIEELYGRVDDPDAFASRQVGGEIKAVIETLEWCKRNGVSQIAIFFDFLNIEKWAIGAYKTNTPMTQAYKQYIDKCGIKIIWHKVASHTGVPLNDRADVLAKKGAQEDPKDQIDSPSAPDNKDKTLSGWIVYNGNLHSGKFMEQVDWLVKAAKDNGITLDAIRNDDLAACVINGKTEIRSPYDKLPDFVLFWDKDVRLSRHLEKAGARLYNSSRSIAICDDKTLTHQILADQGIPMPDTIFAPLVFPGCSMDEDHFIDHVESVFGYPLVVKEAFGSFGAQVYLAKTRDELMVLRKELVYKPHLYQTYVRTSHGRDVRLQVVGDKVVAAMLRTSDSDFRANISAGGKMQPFNPPESFCNLAVKASRLAGLDFSGVDILFGENDAPILCEINSNAHMKNIFDCTGVDVADLIIKHIRNSVLKGSR